MFKWVERMARLMAIVGGIVLTGLIILTCLSVFGRGLNTLGHSALLTGMSQSVADLLISTGVAPISGDFELVEAGVAFAIFAFLPICQLYAAHATVDVFTSTFPKRLQDVLRTFWEVVFALLIVLIAWRLYEGTVSKYSYGETTLLLQFPVWWSYAASLFAAIIAAIVAIYCAFTQVVELVTGKKIIPNSDGAVH